MPAGRRSTDRPPAWRKSNPNGARPAASADRSGKIVRRSEHPPKNYAPGGAMVTRSTPGTPLPLAAVLSMRSGTKGTAKTHEWVPLANETEFCNTFRPRAAITVHCGQRKRRAKTRHRPSARKRALPGDYRNTNTRLATRDRLLAHQRMAGPAIGASSAPPTWICSILGMAGWNISSFLNGNGLG